VASYLLEFSNLGKSKLVWLVSIFLPMLPSCILLQQEMHSLCFIPVILWHFDCVYTSPTWVPLNQSNVKKTHGAVSGGVKLCDARKGGEAMADAPVELGIWTNPRTFEFVGVSLVPLFPHLEIRTEQRFWAIG
jgi:hypothetical protein